MSSHVTSGTRAADLRAQLLLQHFDLIPQPVPPHPRPQRRAAHANIASKHNSSRQLLSVLRVSARQHREGKSLI
eukprot:1930430-Rhodomonas_salina.1